MSSTEGPVPRMPIHECVFPWTQAVLWKVQEHRLQVNITDITITIIIIIKFRLQLLLRVFSYYNNQMDYLLIYLLQIAYNQMDSVFMFARKLLALPFLPPEHIQKKFERLDDRAPEALAPVMDYVYRTWIRSPVFEIHHWSVFMSAIRTNNDLEGWHNKLNTGVATRGAVPNY